MEGEKTIGVGKQESLMQQKEQQKYPGREGPIGETQIIEAEAILRKYKEGKVNLERRIIEDEEWWKMRHWDQFQTKSENVDDPEPKSAWLFNSVINKHADFMDNYPDPVVLPREKSDEPTAKILSEVIPCIMDQNGFESTYSDICWYKIKKGTGVYGVFWNPSKENGIGDIEIKKQDILNLFWEPGINDIQGSRNFFSLALIDSDLLEQRYEFLKGRLTGQGPDGKLAQYYYDDTVDTTGKTVVIDWYYKKQVSDGLMVKTVVHYCKFVSGVLIYASENDQGMENGYYAHGKYPFVFDVMFPEEGTPVGFGYIDIMKDSQMYIDKMNQAIMMNALMACRPRYFIRDGAGINAEDLADLSQTFVRVSGSLDENNIKLIETQPLNGNYLSVLQNKIEELKETSGNRDFSQGATTSGVTAASAIAALQEAGSKTSRDAIKNTYTAYSEVIKLVIELIRQFYSAPRVFRITGQAGMMEFVTFDNSGMGVQQADDFGIGIGSRVPVFDIKVSAQKASPFSRISQNEFAKELYNLGFFNPQLSDQALAAVEMMDFDGKDDVKRRIQDNGTMWQQIQMMQQQMASMAQVIATSTGDTRLADALGAGAGTYQMGNVQGRRTKQEELGEADILGDVKEGINSTAGKARARTARSATPKV